MNLVWGKQSLYLHMSMMFKPPFSDISVIVDLVCTHTFQIWLMDNDGQQ